MSDSEEHKAENEDDQDEKGEKDSTLKILLSTDNHLGYMEKDPIRRMDSFAAMEQVLQLAVALEVDMVLLSGDLFHENKPSRHTLFQTMRLLRKYCMGPQPIRLEVVNPENLQPFASSTVQANYLDEFYSIGLPIFCIHGNHDDPSRDAGNTDLLAPLDILATANLVNYFGRNDEVNNISIKPVLIKKGSTNLALYGLGSLRDERLHRMWQSQKVKFVKPSTTEEWFNVFTLHQNRDLGRGSKNCIHEGMIPEWMDLVVWGHEHQCLIEPVESLVGTFRITQPGSSVATSLTEGEAVRKHVGLLEIRGAQFRITPLPLTRLRGFAIADLSLSDHLDPDDPKVDLKVLNLLRLQVEQLIDQAREHASQLHDALLEALTKLQVENATQIVDRTDSLFSIQNADQVLCRLRVEHSGFTSLNNQRFGAHLVGQVANPSDILLFTRKRKLVERKQAAVNAASASSSAATTAIAPPDLNDTTVEELAYDLLQNHKLDLLNAQQFTLAVEDFVEKEQRQAIVETVNLLVKKQQKALIVRGKSAASPAEVRDLLLQSNIQQNQQDKEPDEDLPNPTRRPLSKKPLVHQDSDSEVSPKTTNNKRTLPNKSSFHNDSMDEEESEAEAETPKRSNHGESDSQEEQSSSHEEIEPPPKKHTRATVASTRSKAAPKTSTVRAKKYDSLSEDDEEVVPDQSDSNDDLEDDPVQVVEAAGKKASGRGRGRGKAKSTTTTGRGRGRGRSNTTQTQTQYDEDGFAAARRASPRRQATASRSRLTANARTQQTQSQLQLQSSQTQSQLTSYLVSRPTVNAKRKAAHYNMDSSDEDEDEAVAAPKPAAAPEAKKSKTSNNLASGWGSASQSATQASATKRSKRK